MNIKKMSPTKIHFEESNLIEGIECPKHDQALKMAWDYLIRFDDLNKALICHAHLVSTIYQTNLFTTQRGKFRLGNVKVGGRICPEHKEINALMNAWVKAINACRGSTTRNMNKYSARAMHVEFEKIHPFLDGNGRVGRLLMWWHEVKLGKQPTLILSAERQKYYEWFK